MSLDPSNGDRSKIVIESTWGLGEPLVSGLVTPDYFLIDKVLLEPVKRTIASKLQEMVADPDARAAVMRSVEEGRQNIPSLTEGQLRAVARGKSGRKGTRYTARHRVGPRCRATGA